MATDETALRTLMQASLAGDARAHRRLLAALIPVLRRYFSRRIASAEDVEDLVQTTLIAVHTRRETYDPARAFAPWLYAIARYKMIDLFRRSRSSISLDDIEDIAEPHDFGERVTARIDIDANLATLSTKQSQAIRSTRLEGLSVAEAAARDGISESDVKISVHRGLKALTKRILGA